MKVKKLKGKSINGFTILGTHRVTLETGRITSHVQLRCDKCGREFDRNSGVDFEHIKCKCMCKPAKPVRQCKFKYIEYQGETFIQTEFCKLHSISESTFNSRINNGETIEEALKNKIEKTCKRCNKQFLGRRNQEYCCKTCYKNAHNTRTRRRKGIPERNFREFKQLKCPQCGKEFMQNRGRLKYCSHECASQGTGIKLHEAAIPRILARQEQQELEKAKKIALRKEKVAKEKLERLQRQLDLTKNCAICGKRFIARSKTNICCSKKCSTKNENRQKDKRLRKNGKPDYSINLNALYIKDNGICQICNRAINFDCDHNSDFYPSIDHIKPIAKGGLHRWDNVQLACRKCNSEKRDTWKE